MNGFPKPLVSRADAGPYRQFPDDGPVARSWQAYVGCLQGRVALITGATGWIGRAVTIAFARVGADVAPCFLNEMGDAVDMGATNAVTGGVPMLGMFRNNCSGS